VKYRVIPALILVPGDIPECEAMDLAGAMQLHARRNSEAFGGRLMLDEMRHDGFVELEANEDSPYSVDDPRIAWPKGKEVAP